jgi:selenocysteine lyase/cysteine desulfurase
VIVSIEGWKEDFALGETIYLNGASHGPLPAVAIDAVGEALNWKRDPSLIDDSIYFRLPDRVRAAGAPFLGVDAENIAVVTGASTGINLVVAGLDWHPGDHVIIPAGEFPANYLPWISLRSKGVEVTVLDLDRASRVAGIEAAMRDRTRVVALGHVNFATGYRIDIDAVGELCADRGVAFVVDASQSLCAVPLDAGRCAATVVSAAGYKWMCSPYGTGLFYVDPAWLERLPVLNVNWESVVGAENFNNLTQLDLAYRPGAARHDAPETASFLNCMAMAASLELLGTIGPERIFAHSSALLDRLIAGLPSPFRPDSDLQPAHRSTILRIVGDDAEVTAAAYQRCRAAGISLSLRENGIRVAPGVWNSPGDIDRLLEVLAST